MASVRDLVREDCPEASTYLFWQSLCDLVNDSLVSGRFDALLDSLRHSLDVAVHRVDDDSDWLGR